ERIDDPDTLHAIAGNRSAQKGLRQRAQALLASRSAARPAVAVKEVRARQLELLAAVQALRARGDVIQAAERVRDAQREWDELARDVAPRDDVAAPFLAACDVTVREAEAVARRRAEADHARTAIEENVAARAALCDRIEALARSEAGPAATADLEQARAEWSRLPPPPDQWGGELRRRFGTACERLADRARERMAAEAVRSELEALVQEAESLAGTTPVTSPKTWKALVARWESRRAALPAGRDVDP